MVEFGFDQCDEGDMIDDDQCDEEAFQWIKKSLLYQELDEPTSFLSMKFDHVNPCQINNNTDLLAVLSTIQYWSVYEWPQSVVKYIATHDINLIIEETNENCYNNVNTMLTELCNDLYAFVNKNKPNYPGSH